MFWCEYVVANSEIKIQTTWTIKDKNKTYLNKRKLDMCVLETTISNMACASCNKNLPPDTKKAKWEHYDDLCQDCNEYIMTNSPFFQADYEGGYSKWSEPLKGILMVNNFENIKRILFFTKNHRKITIPVEAIHNIEEIFPENDYLELEKDQELFNKAISDRIAIHYLDNIKEESPIFLINESVSSLNAIYDLISEYEEEKRQIKPSAKIVDAIKNAHKESIEISVSESSKSDSFNSNKE